MKTSLIRAALPSAVIAPLALTAAVLSISIHLSTVASKIDDDFVVHRIAVGGRNDRRVHYIDPKEQLSDDGEHVLDGNNHLNRHPTIIWAGGDYEDDKHEKVFAPSTRPGDNNRETKHDRYLQSQLCKPPKPHYIGDGYCDSGSEYNNAACKWDGGDCCQSTCEEAKYTCGAGANPGQNHDWDCKDPSASDVSAAAGRNRIQPNCNAPNMDWLGDGFCDGGPPYNTRRCGYDGGDCCEGTCVPGPRLACPPSAFNCRDPSELGMGDSQDEDEDEDENSEEEADCDPPKPYYIGDGYCDNGPEYNNKACSWDGGDCCRDTCEEAKYTCGRSTGPGANPGQNHDWDCKDPAATDEFDGDEDIVEGNPSCDVPHPEYVGDGYCDEFTDDGGIYNSKKCNWDGGDCCPQTCEDGPDFSCSEDIMKCRDPEYTSTNINSKATMSHLHDSLNISPHTNFTITPTGLGVYESQWLNKHNQRRKKYQEKYGYEYVPLVWSKHLQESSQAYADVLATWACEDFDHDPDNKYGENLAVIWGGDSIERVMDAWVEKEELDPNEPYRSGHGHMTAVLWRATKYVGCAQSSNAECNLYVCRYVRPGNCGRGEDTWLRDTMADYSPCGPDCPPPEGCFA